MLFGVKAAHAASLTPALSRREREQRRLLGFGFFVLLGGVG